VILDLGSGVAAGHEKAQAAGGIAQSQRPLGGKLQCQFISA